MPSINGSFFPVSLLALNSQAQTAYQHSLEKLHYCSHFLMTDILLLLMLMALQPVLVCKSHMFRPLQTTDWIMYCNPYHLGILTIGPNVVVIKSGFWHILKSTVISKGTHDVSLVSEYYHLEWSSCHAIGIAERVLIVCVKILLYQCCIFLQRSHGVPPFICSSVKVGSS